MNFLKIKLIVDALERLDEVEIKLSNLPQGGAVKEAQNNTRRAGERLATHLRSLAEEVISKKNN